MLEPLRQAPRGAARLRPAVLALALALTAPLGFAALAFWRDSFGRASGDEGTYLAMAASAALDGDLEFDRRDAGRLEAVGDQGRQAVILQRAGGRISFSKPVLHAVLAAPFYWLLGETGLAVLNALALAAAAWIGWAYLARRGPPGEAALTIVTCTAASAVPAYVAWDTSDALQFALALGGLALALAAARPPSIAPATLLGRFLERPAARRAGAAALGLLAFTRAPNGLVAAAAVVALLAAGRRRWAAEAAVVAALAFGIATLGNQVLSGAPIPYKSERASFTAATGYPHGAAGERALEQFAAGRATHSLAVRPVWQPVVSAYAALYFLVGRHSGLVLYFPAVLVLAGCAAAGWRRRSDRLGAALLLGALAAAAFYLVWLPRNYFGGEGFVGNRYFLPAYPLLLVALDRLPRRRWLVATWCWGAVVLGSALLSVATAGPLDTSSQSHVHRGVFRLFPYESIAPAIDGRRDRYWSDEFVRFVDPYPRVGELSFVLDSDTPPAELLIATHPPHGLMRFVVYSEQPGIELVYQDWRGERVFPVTGREGAVHAEVAIQAPPAWRRHAFWWPDSPVEIVRAFRLAVRTADGRPARASLYYMGAYEVPQRIFDRRVLGIDAPAEARAGTVETLRVRVRNESKRSWSSRRVLPVYLVYRLAPAGGGPAVEGRRSPLPRRVGPGRTLDGRLMVRWPGEPGQWDLTVDLILEGVAWFGERTGEPLGRFRVEVLDDAAWRERYPDSPKLPASTARSSPSIRPSAVKSKRGS